MNLNSTKPKDATPSGKRRIVNSGERAEEEQTVSLVKSNAKIFFALMLCFLTLAQLACGKFAATSRPSTIAAAPVGSTNQQPIVLPTPRPDTPRNKVVAAGVEQTTYTVFYDPTYVKLDYPNGDVPRERGVCADVIVRAFRAAGVDLQQELHEDMRANFAVYPKKWSHRTTDRNIDHRRVANLMVFFERRRTALPVSTEANNYQPGDVVAWDLGGGLLHIGLVSDLPTEADPARHQIVHNINSGARLEDVLFGWKIVGHYRYFAE